MHGKILQIYGGCTVNSVQVYKMGKIPLTNAVSRCKLYNRYCGKGSARIISVIGDGL